MKNLINSLIVFVFIVAMTSCSTSVDRQIIYEQIAGDDNYQALRESMSELAILMTTDQIDLDAISEHIHNNPGTVDCKSEDEAFLQIKGSLEYMQLNCKIRQSRNSLREKYPEYADFSKSDIKELRNVYEKKGFSTTEATSLTIIENN